MEYTYEQWTTARQWAREAGYTKEAPPESVLDMIFSLPEPNPLLADIPEEERDKHIGCAIDASGKRGWLTSVGKNESYILVPHETGAREMYTYNKLITLLRDEPRMAIPGVTPKPEPRMLTTLDDFEIAPSGTVIHSAINILQKAGNMWWVCGSSNPRTNREAHELCDPATVICWGGPE